MQFCTEALFNLIPPKWNAMQSIPFKSHQISRFHQCAFFEMTNSLPCNQETGLYGRVDWRKAYKPMFVLYHRPYKGESKHVVNETESALHAKIYFSGKIWNRSSSSNPTKMERRSKKHHNYFKVLFPVLAEEWRTHSIMLPTQFFRVNVKRLSNIKVAMDFI